jgi:hypothetical protein
LPKPSGGDLRPSRAPRTQEVEDQFYLHGHFAAYLAACAGQMLASIEYCKRIL